MLNSLNRILEIAFGVCLGLALFVGIGLAGVVVFTAMSLEPSTPPVENPLSPSIGER